MLKIFEIKKAITFFCSLLFSFSLVHSQQSVIVATMDSTHLLIGEQTRIQLEIAADKNNQLQIPLIPDTLMKGIEVLEISNPDTIDIGNNRVQIKYDYLITSFDSALYLIPPFKLIAGVDTFYSNQLALKVSTLPVDTESKNIYDIKDVITPKFVWGDYMNILFYILGLCILILIIVYIIFRKKKQKPLFPFKKEEEIKLPPHTKALLALDEIKSEKLLLQGKEKEYHSRISDIIRKYIEERFDTTAMEMTSGQILSQMRSVSDVDYVYDKLKQLLLLADLVKFAKYYPPLDENELSMMNAYLFVNETKIEELNMNEGKNAKANEIPEDIQKEEM